jgi:hypothetical protein
VTQLRGQSTQGPLTQQGTLNSPALKTPPTSLSQLIPPAIGTTPIGGAADASTAADVGANVLLSGVGDVSSAADSATLVTLSVGDSAAASDLASNALITTADAATAVDTAAQVQLSGIADAGSATDNGTASVGGPTAIGGADSATCADAATVVALLAAADAGVGTELALIFAAIAYADAASLADLGVASVPPILVLVSVPRSNGEYGILITPGSPVQSFFEVSPDGLGAGTVLVPNTQLARFLRAVAGSQVVDPVQGELYRLANPFVPQVAGPFRGG